MSSIIIKYLTLKLYTIYLLSLNNEVPLSEMARDLLNTYKYGWKTSYYHNTYDSKTDGDEEQKLEPLVQPEILTDEEDCEACKI